MYAEPWAVRLRPVAMIAVFASLSMGCGGAVKAKVEAPQGDYDWSDYKGTYATAGKPKAEKPDKAVKAEKPADDAPAPKAEDKKTADAAGPKVSRTKIRGESVSLVTPEATAAALTKSLKTKVVSTNVTVGPEYEQIQVVVKGFAVQIVRPASKPDGSGPKVRSPKARRDDLAKTESAFYDGDADVLVLVQAAKKAASKKVLATILKS